MAPPCPIVQVPGAAMVLVGVAGFALSLHFTLVTYRVARPDPRWLPRVCRMDEATCARVVDTRYARLLGLPNSVYGLGWYVLVAGTGAWVLIGRPVPDAACAVLVVLASAVVAFSLLLAWSLVVRLRTPCVLCFAAHGLNVAALALLVLQCSILPR